MDRFRFINDEHECPDQQAYSYLVQRILNLRDTHKVYLFAGGDASALPVTMPVNAAAVLAVEGIRCLLIDLDLSRNAIARCFELPVTVGRRARPLRTSLDDVFVWPAAYFSAGHSQLAVLSKLIDKARRRYDVTVVYAPNLDANPLRKSVAQLCDCGFVFSNNAPQATRLAAFFKSAECKLVGSLQVNCRFENKAGA